jgi:hypothetical protein
MGSVSVGAGGVSSGGVPPVGGAGGMVGSGGAANGGAASGGVGSGGAPPTCSDNAKNGTETDIDCGGATCAPCAVGDFCFKATDCVNHVCLFGRCLTAECTDGVLNGNETGIDCGGGMCTGCSTGQPCTLPRDCASTSCVSGKCACKPLTCAQIPTQCGPSLSDGCGAKIACPCAALCMDKKLDGQETSADCGGPDCKPCGDGLTCTLPRDCTSGVCHPASTGAVATCRPVACNDKIRNGAETDVDCGGATCAGCARGLMCKAGTDCMQGVCTNGTCACTPLTCDIIGPVCGTFPDGCGASISCMSGCAVLCNDQTKDGSETDVDCGGADCGQCTTGDQCARATDCDSGSCSGRGGQGLFCD